MPERHHKHRSLGSSLSRSLGSRSSSSGSDEDPRVARAPVPRGASAIPLDPIRLLSMKTIARYGLPWGRRDHQESPRACEPTLPLPEAFRLAKTRSSGFWQTLPQQLAGDKTPRNHGRPYGKTLKAKFVLHRDMHLLFSYLCHRLTLLCKLVQLGTPAQLFSLLPGQAQVVECRRWNVVDTTVVVDVNEDADVQVELARMLHTHEFLFVSVIRNVKGELIKVQTARAHTGEAYDTAWVKQHVCYPRYKAMMKLHLVRGGGNMRFYNGVSAWQWDEGGVYNGATVVVERG